MPPRKRLGQLLTELKVIDEHQLQSALGHQKQWGGKLGTILVQKGFCREDQMISALSQHLGMPSVRLSEVKIDPRAVKTVSKSVAEKLHVFAYEVTGSGRSEVITIAMSDPTDLSAVDQLAFHTGKRIKPILAGDSEVIAAIQQHYGHQAAEGGEQGHATPAAGSRPFVDGAARGPGAAMRATPVAPIQAVPPGGIPTPRYVAPVPAAAQPPMADAPAAAEPPPPERGAAEPMDLIGEDLPADAPMEGLEPIAAHTQGEESVEGAEDVAGQGSAADAVAGLEEANPHDAVYVADVPAMDGLEQGVEVEQAASAAADGSAEALPLEDQAALQGWQEGQAEGAPIEGGDAGVAQAGDARWDKTGELPVDAIIGTADALETAPATDAPDAWSDIADPLAAPGADTAAAAEESASAEAQDASGWEELPAAEQGGAGDSGWIASAEEEPSAAQEPPPGEGGEQAPADDGGWSAAEGDSLLAPPGDAEAPAEEVAIEAEGWSDDPGAPVEEAPADAGEPAPFQMEEDGGAEISSTARQGWLSRHESSEEGAAAADEQGADMGSADPSLDEYGQQDGAGGDQPAADEYSQQELAEGEAPAEGWIATTEDHAQSGWFGDALSSTMPLSPADLGTLAAIGLDPSDTAAAQRVLACLVRVLNRRQAIDLDELAAEIRESRLAGETAAQAQVEEPVGDPDPAGSVDEGAQTSGSGQDPWSGSHDS